MKQEEWSQDQEVEIEKLREVKEEKKNSRISWLRRNLLVVEDANKIPSVLSTELAQVAAIQKVKKYIFRIKTELLSSGKTSWSY